MKRKILTTLEDFQKRPKKCREMIEHLEKLMRILEVSDFNEVLLYSDLFLNEIRNEYIWIFG